MTTPGLGEVRERLERDLRISRGIGEGLSGTPSRVIVDDDALSACLAELARLEGEVERLTAERDRLISAVGEHVTVRSDYLARAEAAEALLAREGWIAVPREPTEEMLRAGFEAQHPKPGSQAYGFNTWATWEQACQLDGFREEKAVVYRAMISVAGGEGDSPSRDHAP